MCINYILCHFRSRMWEMSSPDTLEILPGVPESLGHGFRMFSCFLTLSETPGHEFNSPRWMGKTPDMDIYNIAQSMSNAHTIEACRVQHFNKKIAINQYNLHGDLLSRTSASHRMSTLIGQKVEAVEQFTCTENKTWNWCGLLYFQSLSQSCII